MNILLDKPQADTDISRQTLLMLIIAQALVILPHVLQVPVWIALIAVACAYWRWMIHLQSWRFPSLVLKASMAIIGGIMVVLVQGLQHSLEVWCSLLLLAFALKLIEAKNRRDAYAVIFLAYFVLCVEFIFNQSIWIAGYQSVAFIMITASMISLNQRYGTSSFAESIRMAGAITLQALPLMLILFIVFPRLAPFWTVPLKSSATTGLATEMTPGDIARLTRSDDIVFRAVFDEIPPAAQDLYWRGLVYSSFSLGQWSKGPIPTLLNEQDWIDWSDQPARSRFVPKLTNQMKISYQVLLEPTQQIWQFGLDLAVPRPAKNGLSWDFRLVSREPMHTLTRYVVDSYPNVRLDHQLPDWSRRRETRLPPNDNPKIRAWAEQQYRQAGSDQAFIEQLLQEIRNNRFHYTLEPPTLDRINSIDQFWFDTRSGFCTHYAGALVYLLRAVDIPARMIGGYQGGEINPLTGHVVVRQYHAHAWVEAWLPESGWQRIDPTAAVAPERVETGLDAALQQSERNSLSMFTHARLHNTLGLAKLLHLLESAEHRWNMFVIGYDGERQLEFLKRLLGEITVARVGLLLLSGLLLTLAIVAFSILPRTSSNRRDPVLQLCKKFTRRAHTKGYQRNANESYPAFIRRIGTCQQNASHLFDEIAGRLEYRLYGVHSQAEKNDIRRLKSDLRQLHREMI